MAVASMRALRHIGLIINLLLVLSTNAQTGFMENWGRLDSRVLADATFDAQTIYLNRQGFMVLLHDQEAWFEAVETLHSHNQPKQKHSGERSMAYHAIQYRFEGAVFNRVIPSKTQDAYYNFYLGIDSSKWRSGVRKHGKMTFLNVYPHIDMEFESIGQRFKYNFILKPGADISDIKLKIEGADDYVVHEDRIEVQTRFGSYSELMPISYLKSADGSRVAMTMKYVEGESGIGFNQIEIPKGQELVIDPELVFSTYAGNSVDNFGFTATYDSHGNLYAGGIATSPPDLVPGRYPVTPGAFDVTYNGGVGESPANLPCDIAISKYDATGATLLYATYLGGKSDEYPHSMIVDSSDQLIVMGTFKSNNFPNLNNSTNANKGGYDVFVVKFNEVGSTLLGSQFIGNNADDGLNQSTSTKYFYADDFRGEVIVDRDDNIYIATSIKSDLTIPAFNLGFQKARLGGQEGMVACFTPDLSGILWGSYFGGRGDDAIYGIDLGLNGDLYIVGGTTSTDLQKTTNIGPKYQGGRTDGFIARISHDGKTLKDVVYWGTDGYDQVLNIEVDKRGDIFVVGHSTGDMPKTSGVYANADGKQFISKFSPELNTVLASTVYGSGKAAPDLTVNAFLVDECDKIFVSGWGGSLYTGPQTALSNMPISQDALQKTTDGNDFHLIVFRKDMTELVYGTYFGGDLTDDHVDGGTSRFDKKGVIYQSVCSSCPPASDGQTSRVSDFPTTPGAYAVTNNSPRCSNASFKLAFGNLNRKPELEEQLYTVRATDVLSFTYPITDPDRDTIDVYFDLSEDVDGNFTLKHEHLRGIGRVDASFEYAPGCENVGDTITVPAHAVDIGCPASKDSISSYRIVVTAPPPLPAPDVICLNFLNKDGIRLEWNATTQSKFFKEMHLYKVYPNGDTILLKVYTSQAAGVLTDVDVIAPRSNNYTYFLKVLNICDIIGPKSYDVNTVKEHEFPVETTYLRTVTVQDSVLRIEWLRSDEDDFGHYEIYKGTREGGTQFLALITDRDQLFFIDEDVNVDQTSYCYQIRVSDNCGHLSAKSNIGCSIVIRGTSHPFEFHLNWDEYIDWAGGVEDYELMRANDIEVLTPIVRVNHPQRNMIDDNLDYDWGGYWYSVVAFEGPGSQYAESRSNDIYLVQPPLLHVPNAVTVDGNGLNDVFSWTDVFVLDMHMQVYTRWGQKVFETTDKNADWNTLFKDNDLQHSKVYIWVVNYSGWDGSRHSQKGTLTVLR